MLKIALTVFACIAGFCVAQAPERAPDGSAKGKVYEWKSKDGLVYQYYVPKDYDAATGANLTFILHGSNLDRRWGFANHAAGQFRADDVVVCPDGTTANGAGGFNSMQGQKDLERLHALHDELRALFKVRATFLYGHSQGSFFAFYYAGAYPADVQGLVGQASGVWIGTQATKKHHHQAVSLMHGTADPVVPYGQSVGGLSFYRDAKYPIVHLRSLDGWNHWPNQGQTEQQLAWCEGMTTEDPARLAIALATLDFQKEAVDPVALYQVAERAAAFAGIPDAARKMATAAMAAVDKDAAEHIDAIEKSVGKGAPKLADKPWVGHLSLFLRHFRGVPACDKFAEGWKKVVEQHDDVAAKQGRAFWQDADKKPKDAFEAGVVLVRDGFLSSSAENEEMLTRLEKWADDAKGVGLGKKELSTFKAVVPVVRDAREKGKKAFDKIAKRFH